MTQPLHVVILAAGEGKRMKSALPKVLQPIAGRPMLAHVIDAARQLQPEAIHVVYGHGGDAVRRRLPTSRTCGGPSSASAWVPATPCSRQCRGCRTPPRCWCCTATCR
jgi:N-acetylglucosamine-1-phosphate uridyltransferase (contains nucleotidyltransferase and I-patch acetyltransferase domains)